MQTHNKDREDQHHLSDVKLLLITCIKSSLLFYQAGFESACC